MRDVGECRVIIVIAAVIFNRAHANNPTKIPQSIHLEAHPSAAIALAEARTCNGVGQA